MRMVDRMNIQYWTDYPDQQDLCPRCNSGIGEHTCWRITVQQMPSLHHPNPVKIKRPAK